jgi:hypothetical protein
MATSKKTKGKVVSKKQSLPKPARVSQVRTQPKAAPQKKPQKGDKGLKCCPHCPDFEHCEDKNVCCDYCDFYLNAKCNFGKKKGIPSVDDNVELPDYRGDDYGIDDYEAYEPVYE